MSDRFLSHACAGRWARSWPGAYSTEKGGRRKRDAPRIISPSQPIARRRQPVHPKSIIRRGAAKLHRARLLVGGGAVPSHASLPILRAPPRAVCTANRRPWDRSIETRGRLEKALPVQSIQSGNQSLGYCWGLCLLQQRGDDGDPPLVQLPLTLAIPHRGCATSLSGCCSARPWVPPRRPGRAGRRPPFSTASRYVGGCACVGLWFWRMNVP